MLTRVSLDIIIGYSTVTFLIEGVGQVAQNYILGAFQNWFITRKKEALVALKTKTPEQKSYRLCFISEQYWLVI